MRLSLARSNSKGKPLTNFRAVGVVFFGVAHAITFADSGIRTADDLVGKRVAVGTPGSGTFASAERVFRSLGVWDKINRIPLLGAQAGEAMSDGKADAFFWTGPEPDRVTMEAATKKPIRAIDIYTPATKTDFFKQFPYFARYVFPANSYRGNHRRYIDGRHSRDLVRQPRPARAIGAEDGRSRL